jgi:hypothetical protein
MVANNVFCYLLRFFVRTFKFKTKHIFFPYESSQDTKSTETEINWGTYEQSRPENPHASEWVRMTPFEFVIPNFDRILDLKLGPKYIDYFNFW